MDKLFSHSKKSVNYIKNIPWGHEHLHDEFSFKNNRHVMLSVLLVGYVIAINILFFSFKSTVLKTSADELASQPPAPLEQYDVKVLSLRYFPMTQPEATGSAQVFDASRTGMPTGTSIEAVRSRVDVLRDNTVNALHEATKYKGYRDVDAQPSLQYQVVEEKEFLQPIPVSSQFVASTLSSVKSPDHFKVLNGSDQALGISNICDYVENQNVKEVWVWFYHTNEVAPIESNMAPKTGGEFGAYGYRDISNSLGADDLPRCAKTYTVYDFNYTRDVSLHTFGHHLERVFAYVDSEVFANYMYRGANGSTNACGNVHHPPNIDFSPNQGDSALHDDYDYGNEQTRQSTCQNWKPDGTGVAEPVNCHTWQGAGACNNWDESGHLKYQIWWMQNMPGMNNGLTYKGKPMQNWWKYIGDWDNPVNQKPTVAFTNPQPGFVAVSNFSVNVDVSHPNGIEKVEFYVNSQQTPIASSTESPYTTTLNLPQIQRGQMTVSARAYVSGRSFGATGEASVSGSNSYIDNVAPMVKINSPKLGHVYDDNRINFNLEFIDDSRMNLGGYMLVNETTNVVTPPKWYSVPMISETLTLPDGVYTMNVSMSDQAYNMSETSFIFFVKADPDNDGFTTKLEDFMGTNNASHCGTNAWPPDFNNDKVVNVADQGILGSNFAGKGSAKYNKRYDFNMDGAVNVADMGLFSKFVGKSCGGPTSIIQPIVTEQQMVSCTYTTNITNGELKVLINGLSHNHRQLQPLGSNFVLGGNVSLFSGEAHALSISLGGLERDKCTNSYTFPQGWVY